MSFVTKINSVVVTDIAALRAAVDKLKAQGVNINLVENTKPRVHGWDQAPVCEYVVQLPNTNYDVGFKYDATTKAYEPVLDTYRNEVGSQLAPSCRVDSTVPEAHRQIGKLAQYYAEAAATNAAVMQGYSVDGATTDAEGNIHLTISVD